jgi:deazaflavin-dependent oxidoreductase (nitroreductase family)
MTPPRPILRIGWAVHKALHRLSGGRLSTNRPNERVGTLFLVSRGRKTGTLRRNGLYFVEDGPAFAVVASNAGEDADPSWWLNLQATPDADVELGTRRIPVRARPLSKRRRASGRSSTRVTASTPPTAARSRAESRSSSSSRADDPATIWR